MVKPSEPRSLARDTACMIVEDGHSYCIDPLRTPLELISKRWALFVICVLGNQQEVRFSEIKRAIPGISSRALSSVLAALQEHGIAERSVDGARTPPAVRYTLSTRGRALRRALIPLVEWASCWDE